ncbi:MAG: hypothetical protein ICV55_12600 [Coleofasciculus sp. C3-bin4]|nr:hypothetical protein [Coleofasciculus sp. C3-bin4]
MFDGKVRSHFLSLLARSHDCLSRIEKSDRLLLNPLVEATGWVIQPDGTV